MSARSTDMLRLEKIVSCIDDIAETVAAYGVDEDAYVSPEGIDEWTRRRALDQLLTLLCEEAREITDETRSRMPGIPWTSVAEVRSYLVHAYDSINAEVVWEIISQDLAALRSSCADCLAEMRAGEYVPTYSSRTKERKARSAK